MSKGSRLEVDQIVNSSLSSGTVKSAKLASNEAFFSLEEKNGLKKGLTLKDHLKRSKQLRKEKLYKEPKILRCKDGDWSIQYYYQDPTNLKFKAFKERGGMNYLRGMAKEAEAKALRKDVADWLAAGNSPFDEDKTVVQWVQRKQAKIKHDSSGWTISRALSAFRSNLEVSNYKKPTIRAYTKYLKVFEAWVIQQGLAGSQMCEFTEMKLNEYLSETYGRLDWSATTYNNYLGFMIGFLNKCMELEKLQTGKRGIKYDFEPGLLKPKQSVAKKNKAISPELRKKIIAECERLEYWMLRDYLNWIFCSFMRPDEIREMRVRDIDTDNRQISVPQGKTGFRLVPVSDQLLSLIVKRRLVDQDNYVFGMRGEVGPQRMSVAYFQDQFSVIRDNLHLDPNIVPYSFKGSGIIAMVQAGIPARDIMQVSGHKTEKAFAAYIRDLVVDSSKMKGSLVDF